MLPLLRIMVAVAKIANDLLFLVANDNIGITWGDEVGLFKNDFKEGTPETVTLLMPSKAREATVTQEGEKITFRINGNGVMENGSGSELFFWRSSGPDRNLLRLESDLGTGSLIVRLQK